MVTYLAFSDQQALLLSVNQEFLVTGMCPIVGMGDSEKAAGEEIGNQLLLASGPCPEGQNGKRNPARHAPVSTNGQDSGRPTFPVMLHLPKVTLTHPLSHLTFFSSGLAIPLHSGLARLNSTRCMKISSMSNDSLYSINSFSDNIQPIIHTHAHTRAHTHAHTVLWKSSSGRFVQDLMGTTTLNRSIHLDSNPALPFTSERRQHRREATHVQPLGCEVGMAPLWSPESLLVRRAGVVRAALVASDDSTPSTVPASSEPPFCVHQGCLLGRS